MLCYSGSTYHTRVGLAKAWGLSRAVEERKKERGVKVDFATFGKGSRLLAVPCFSQRLGFLGKGCFMDTPYWPTRHANETHVFLGFSKKSWQKHRRHKRRKSNRDKTVGLEDTLKNHIHRLHIKENINLLGLLGQCFHVVNKTLALLGEKSHSCKHAQILTNTPLFVSSGP